MYRVRLPSVYARLSSPGRESSVPSVRQTFDSRSTAGPTASFTSCHRLRCSGSFFCPQLAQYGPSMAAPQSRQWSGSRSPRRECRQSSSSASFWTAASSKRIRDYPAGVAHRTAHVQPPQPPAGWPIGTFSRFHTLISAICTRSADSAGGS